MLGKAEGTSSDDGYGREETAGPEEPRFDSLAVDLRQSCL